MGCAHSSTFMANLVPRTPSMVVGVFTFIASGERFAIWPEMIAKVPCCTSVTNSPSWVVGLKLNCLSSIRLFGPAEKRVLSMKVIPTLPLGPVVSTSACSSRSPVLAACCTLFRTSETCPATFLIWPISAQAEWPNNVTNQATKTTITVWRRCIMLASREKIRRTLDLVGTCLAQVGIHVQSCANARVRQCATRLVGTDQEVKYARTKN